MLVVLPVQNVWIYSEVEKDTAVTTTPMTKIIIQTAVRMIP